ncbi:beta-citrylglutamate synthase B isoform X3 [Heterodontus francisci]|uniref:beta-citrylglutamate synthase B isoform X3 n=1 Tax=Heterodontus francisci TaxID=7792 RepID=UPI00355B75C6
MSARVWFVTDRRILQDYPQQEIERALRQKCAEEEVEFRMVLMDEIVITIEQGALGLRIKQEPVTSYPQVVVVRVPTPSVQNDSDITLLRHLEKMGCRLANRPQAILHCVNKFWTFQELAGHGIPLPDTFSYGGHENFSKMIDEAEPLGYPVVVKNTRGHRGINSFSFCSGVGMMYQLSEQGKQLAIQVSNILGMDVCGIDLLRKDDGSFVVCEANANVGFRAFDKACNLDVSGIIADYALSLLPSRLTRKMSLLSVVSSASETSEPEVGVPVSAIPESVFTMSVGSSSSESDPEIVEVRDSDTTASRSMQTVLPEPGYNMNNLINTEMKLLSE